MDSISISDLLDLNHGIALFVLMVVMVFSVFYLIYYVIKDIFFNNKDFSGYVIVKAHLLIEVRDALKNNDCAKALDLLYVCSQEEDVGNWETWEEAAKCTNYSNKPSVEDIVKKQDSN